jgi:hypothetical protein
MKKLFLILIISIGFGITANAQDIILKHDGSEIQAKVFEVTNHEIKYKEFDFQSGPIRNINITEVLMITYENGKREVFNKSSSKRQGVTNCAKKTAFGLDIGVGGSFYAISNEKLPTFFAQALGIRVMHHFNPYFGVDFLKINWITDVWHSGLENQWTMRLQMMSGIRGNSPAFFKCMSGYAAFRLGYGMDFRLLTLSGVSHFEGLCLETELGLNLTRTVFAGFAYNYHKYFDKGVDSKIAMHTLSFRLGFNFGKLQETKKKEVFSRQTSLQTKKREVFNRQTSPLTRQNSLYNRPLSEIRRDGVGLISAGAGLMGLGIILMGSGLSTDNSNCLTAGYVFIGAGGALTIASIPLLAVAGERKRAIKNDLSRQYFGIDSYTYQPTLNFNCTGNGLGISLQL